MNRTGRWILGAAVVFVAAAAAGILVVGGRDHGPAVAESGIRKAAQIALDHYYDIPAQGGDWDSLVKHFSRIENYEASRLADTTEFRSEKEGKRYSAMVLVMRGGKTFRVDVRGPVGNDRYEVDLATGTVTRLVQALDDPL